MKLLRAWPIVFLFLDACIDPLPVDIASGPSRLVVDGFITDKPGPYQVKLFYSSPVDNTTLRPLVESGASVWIIDDQNVSEVLAEVLPGVYQTSSSTFKGEVGKSYYVQIKTLSGNEYRSNVQRMEPAGTLDDLYVEFEKDGITQGNADKTLDAFRVYVDAHGNSGESNLFRWRWKGTYEALTFPEKRVINRPVGPPIPNPIPCSGYINNGGALTKIFECNCCSCWPSEFSSSSVVSGNRSSDDYIFNRAHVGTVPVTGMRFYDRFYIEVEQLSVSEGEYEFWRLANIQHESSGNLFQPNAIRVHGNITSVSNPEEEVLGFFSVSAVEKKSMFIEKASIPVPIPALDSTALECISRYPGAAVEKPPFW